MMSEPKESEIFLTETSEVELSGMVARRDTAERLMVLFPLDEASEALDVVFLFMRNHRYQNIKGRPVVIDGKDYRELTLIKDTDFTWGE